VESHASPATAGTHVDSFRNADGREFVICDHSGDTQVRLCCTQTRDQPTRSYAQFHGLHHLYLGYEQAVYVFVVSLVVSQEGEAEAGTFLPKTPKQIALELAFWWRFVRSLHDNSLAPSNRLVSPHTLVLTHTDLMPAGLPHVNSLRRRVVLELRAEGIYWRQRSMFFVNGLDEAQAFQSTFPWLCVQHSALWTACDGASSDEQECLAIVENALRAYREGGRKVRDP
jgi:hypothetical protein